MNKNLIQGYQYCVTTNEEVVVTDSNGLNLVCPSGQQTYFIATTDEVSVSGDAIITQSRGTLKMRGGAGGGGGSVGDGEVVLGGRRGGQVINDCKTMTDGEQQFNGNVMSEWTTDFPELTNGTNMFYRCTNLTSYRGGLPSLTNGSNMFDGCTGLTEWTVNLPSLTNGRYMFGGCTGLTDFEGDLSSLAGSGEDGGYHMFEGCTSLKRFRSALSDLSSATGMFGGCKLDLASLQTIVNSVKTYTSGTHPITIGVDANEVTQEQQNNMNSILTGKGWTVTWQRN